MNTGSKKRHYSHFLPISRLQKITHEYSIWLQKCFYQALRYIIALIADLFWLSSLVIVDILSHLIVAVLTND